MAALTGLCLSLMWLFALTPRAKDIEVIKPNLDTNTQTLASFQYHGSDADNEGLYWIKFTTEPLIYPLNRLKLRTLNCVHEMSTNHGDWVMPQNLDLICDNKEGLRLRNTAKSLSQKTTWHFAGSTRGDSYGVFLEKDWTELPVALGLVLFTLFLGALVFLTLPAHTLTERVIVTTALIGAFGLRFWLVFIESPPQINIFSDMAAYYMRADEILRGHYDLGQLFQPIGFTLWSLWIRSIGDFELFNWLQVAFSWGTVLLIYLIAKEKFGGVAASIAAIFGAVHVPLAAFATFHMAENIYAFLITLTLWLIMKTLKSESLVRYFLLGLLMMIAFYFKGNHAFFIPIFSLWLLWQGRHEFFKSFLRVSVMGIGCLLIVAPHMAWTWKHLGKPQFGPTAGALNFVEGKCPSKDNEDSTGSRWMSPLFGITGERTYKKWDRPFTDQAYFWKAGLECIQNDPWVLVSSLRYIYYLAWGNILWPIMATSAKEVYLPWETFFYYGLLPLALLGLLVLRKDKDRYTTATVLLMMSLFLTVWFFKSENRFRVPFDALVITWSSLGAGWLAQQAVAMLAPLRIQIRRAASLLKRSVR